MLTTNFLHGLAKRPTANGNGGDLGMGVDTVRRLSLMISYTSIHYRVNTTAMFMDCGFSMACPAAHGVWQVMAASDSPNTVSRCLGIAFLLSYVIRRPLRTRGIVPASLILYCLSPFKQPTHHSFRLGA